MRASIWIAVALPLLAAPLAGCHQSQQEKTERGLAVPGETTTPESQRAMQETTQERQQLIEQKEQAADDKAFDQTNDDAKKQQ